MNSLGSYDEILSYFLLMNNRSAFLLFGVYYFLVFLQVHTVLDFLRSSHFSWSSRSWSIGEILTNEKNLIAFQLDILNFQ